MQNRFPNQNQNQKTVDPSLEDKILTCCERSCGQTFLFSARDQAFYAENNYTEPRRCKPCRDVRKAQRNGGQPVAPSEPFVEYRGQSYGQKPAAPAEENRGYQGDSRRRGRRNRDDDFDSDFGDGYRRRR